MVLRKIFSTTRPTWLQGRGHVLLLEDLEEIPDAAPQVTHPVRHLHLRPLHVPEHVPAAANHSSARQLLTNHSSARQLLTNHSSPAHQVVQLLAGDGLADGHGAGVHDGLGLGRRRGRALLLGLLGGVRVQVLPQTKAHVPET